MIFWEIGQKVLHYPLITFGETVVTLLTILNFLIVLALAFLIAALTQWFLKRRVLKIAKFDSGFQYMISRIVGYCVFLLGFFIGLQALGIDLTSFTVLAGAVGVGIGFGLQNIINNFVSSIIILSERQLQVGDRVEVGGVNGFIQKIGARSSVLLTSDHLIVLVPNSEFIAKPVTRWWGRDYPSRVAVEVGVAYESDLKLVRDLLLQIAATNPTVLKEPAPFVGIGEFGTSWITFKLFVSSMEMVNNEMALRTELYISIKKAFEEKGISIPFQQHEVSIKEPVKIKMV